MNVAIVGTGQLAQMMALAGKKLGITCSFLREANESDQCVAGLGDIVTLPANIDPEQLFNDLGKPKVITVEKESVDIELLRQLKSFCPVYPDPDAIRLTQNRLLEKSWLVGMGIGTAKFAFCNDIDTLQSALRHIGYPVIAKSCEDGYDGLNQWRLNSTEDVKTYAEQILAQDSIVEQKVNFHKEVSIIGVRNTRGDFLSYPVTENHHENGVLLTSVAPASGLSEKIGKQAKQIVEQIMTQSDYVGVLTVECFVTDDGLLVNELAPRVHNSGHWTMDACDTSQFENHLRAITGMTLGNTEPLKPAAMVNLLGVSPDNTPLVSPQAVRYNYLKSLKPGRKMGHINLTADTHEHAAQLAQQQVMEIYRQGNPASRAS